MIGPYNVAGAYLLNVGMALSMSPSTHPVRREVALNATSAGMESKRCRPVRAELASLALMDTLNIAKVLDAGNQRRGSALLRHELVRGIRSPNPAPGSSTVRQRLEFFSPGRRAVQHAHQRMSHRELKPSNVLGPAQTGSPCRCPRLWGGQGTVSATDRAHLAHAFSPDDRYTPLYMSP